MKNRTLLLSPLIALMILLGLLLRADGPIPGYVTPFSAGIIGTNKDLAAWQTALGISGGGPTNGITASTATNIAAYQVLLGTNSGNIGFLNGINIWPGTNIWTGGFINRDGGNATGTILFGVQDSGSNAVYSVTTNTASATNATAVKGWKRTSSGQDYTYGSDAALFPGNLTASRVLVSGADGSVTNVSGAGGANTVLHGTTPAALSAVVEADLSLTDVTTANASTSAHGLLPKLDNVATHFLNGQGGYTTPAGGGGSSTFNVNQFSSGSGADGTNIISGVPLTNATVHGTLYQTNASTGNYSSMTQGGIVFSNFQTGNYIVASNQTIAVKGTTAGSMLLSNAAVTVEQNRIDSTGHYGIGQLTNLLGNKFLVNSNDNGTNFYFYGSGQPAITITGGTLRTNPVSGYYELYTNGIDTFGTSGGATITETASSGDVTATTFTGSGANLTSLNAGNLSSGVVPAAQLANGGSLTNVVVASNPVNGGIGTGQTLASGSVSYFNPFGANEASELTARRPIGLTCINTNFIFNLEMNSGILGTNIYMYIFTNGVAWGNFLTIVGTAATTYQVQDTTHSFSAAWTNRISVGLSNNLASGSLTTAKPSWSWQRIQTSSP